MTWCYARVRARVRQEFPTINLCARTAHCTERDCICIADLAMIRDHRSWLLWETRRKVITDKPPSRIRDIYVVILGLRRCACACVPRSVFDLKRDSTTDDARRCLNLANLIYLIIFFSTALVRLLRNRIVSSPPSPPSHRSNLPLFRFIRWHGYRLGWHGKRDRGYSLQVTTHPLSRAAQFAYPPRLCPLCPKHAINPLQLSTVSYARM